MSVKVYRNLLRSNGFVKISDFFSDLEKTMLLKYFDEIEDFKEEKNKHMIYYEENNKKSRIEYFYKYHSGVRNLLNVTLTPFLNEVLEKEQVLFKDKMNWKYPNGNGFKAHQDHCAWNDFNVSMFHSIALSGNHSNKENGCLQFSGYTNNVILNQSNNLGEIDNLIDKELPWEYVESSPNDLIIFNSFVPHKSDQNKSLNSRRLMYLTFNNKDEGNFYEEYNKNKRLHFPPNIERTKEYNFQNNKYNLANPLL
jgi:2-aminoethylphosphonate dioxygenase